MRALKRTLSRWVAVGVVAVATAGYGVAPAQAATPSNDDIAAAADITALPFSDARDTTEATYALDDSACGSATVWYRYTPSESGWVELNTQGSNYDTTLALYSGSPGSLTRILCNDDSVYGLQSQIVQHVDAGTTYYISAGHCCGAPWEPGQIGPGGGLQFNALVAPPGVTSAVAQIVSATVTRSGTVTVTGRITCDVAGQASVTVDLKQPFARINTAQGLGGTWVECGPTATTWTLQVTSATSIRFGAGAATANTSGWAGNATGGTYFSSQQQLRLRVA